MSDLNMIILMTSCFIAIAALRSRGRHVAVAVAVNFMILTGHNILAEHVYIFANEIQMVPFYIFNLFLSFAFLIIYVYLNAWTIAFVMSLTIGILSYSIGTSLYDIKPLYYGQMMQVAAIAQLLALIYEVLRECDYASCIFRGVFDRARRYFARFTSNGLHK